MSALKKKQSVVYAEPTVVSAADSPASKSEQGGGARLDAGLDLDADLDVGLDRLSLESKSVKTPHETDVFAKEPQTSNDDVFASPNDVTENFQAAIHPTQALRTMASMPSVQGVIPSMDPIKVLRNRASHTGIRSQVGNIDAQSYYPATACVFVANLPEFIRDSRLEAELTRSFSKYGTVFVKIRRDQRNMPFAFCQYTKDEDAHEAMKMGKGTLIEGRPCRTEMVKANRTFVLYDVDFHAVSTDDARALMSTYGPLAKCEALHPQIQEAMGTKGGVLAEFTTFDPNRDVVSAFRHDPQYRVIPYDLKKGVPKSKIDRDEAWLQRYEIDRRSIFVGNLPVDVPNVDEQLSEIAQEVGVVEKVQVVRKEGNRGGRSYPIAFGFVEFAGPDLADAAVKRLNGYTLQGSQLRVERKSSREPQSTQRVRPGPVFQEDSEKDMTPVKSLKSLKPKHSQRLTSTDEQIAETTEPATPSHAVVGAGNALSSASRIASNNGTASAPASAPPHPHPYPVLPYGNHGYGPPTFGTPYHNNGLYPATPQGTPGMGGPIYGSPYWMTPYIQDLNFGMNFYHAYSSPLAVSTGTSAVGVSATGASADGDVATTPTKAKSSSQSNTKRLDGA